MNLMDIQSIVQSIAEATAAVLKIEVEIVNHEFIRIACTGEMQVNILKRLEGDLVYKEVFYKEKPIIIKNPGFEEICSSCMFFRNCIEMGEVSVPIMVHGQAIGVIGLLAFNKEQQDRLFENIEGILTFLDRMAYLLASKLDQFNMMDELEMHNKKMIKMLDLVQEGVLITEPNTNIIEINEQAKKILGITENNPQPEYVTRFIEKVLNIEIVEHQTFELHHQLFQKSLIVTKKEILGKNQSKETLLTIVDVERIQDMAEKVSEEQMKSLQHIVGSSKQINEVKAYAFRASQSKSTIMIQGESGTGKEVFAKAIHQVSKRKGNMFIAVNCGAIPENLLESELFGYEKGAFTGASNIGKVGKFELANGGTIFLDEIGEMPLHLQVKLLRVLQENEIERVGGNKIIPIDVRIIAATNRELSELINEGLFREDLYFRLNVIPMSIPPLRSRPEDIVSLCDYFVSEYNEIFNANVLGFSKNVMDKLLQYPWKGNVRELKNFVEYLFNFIQNGYITLENAGNLIDNKLILKNLNEVPNIFSLEILERDHIKKTVEFVKKNNQNIEDAAMLLGISRATLFRKLKKYHNDI
ncbi:MULTISPECIES: sigma 54-interacting transcriptional regulator [unclassified Sporosarcina]|uniref:sigma-54-dependent Fis family transcriptional regulator n=1 Tax=unclassified Sporosarcina TaxID=2647733 RepID=UPI00203E1558|nr:MULTISPECIES: sigma 54-interacting transcriptional regulator [unclassified Sporosarcina]GKV66914.1 ATPase AAA [Sporosarcina sp. NCCP-2331]GLB57209.1 ATPase AAA [Sporosarcina sp. NCCP-2378]